MAAVFSPSTSYSAARDLPWLSSSWQAFSVPLTSPPLHSDRCGQPTFSAFGGDDFGDVFGARRSGSKGGADNQRLHNCQQRFAQALEKSTAERRLTRPEWDDPKSSIQPKSGFIGLWLDDNGGDFLDSLLADCQSDGDEGVEARLTPEICQRSRARTNSSGASPRSPRSRTLAAPSELLESSFQILEKDSVRGPAAFWQAARRPASPSREVDSPVRLLANLDAELSRRRLEARSTQLGGLRRPQESCEDSASAALAKASEREDKLKKSAKAELELTERRLKTLEAAAASTVTDTPKARKATSSSSSSTAPSPFGQTGSSSVGLVPKAASVQATPGAAGGEAEKFLAENSTKDGVISLQSGLQYKILKSGDGKFHPQPDAVSAVLYTGKLTNGFQFDAQILAPYEMNPQKVIKGFREALPKMVEGDKWELYVPPSLGYGAAGVPQLKIPADAILIFQIELVEIKGEKVEKAPVWDSNVNRYRDTRGRFAKAPDANANDEVPAASDSQPIVGIANHADLIRRFLTIEEEIAQFKTLTAEKTFRNETKKEINKKVVQISANAKSIRECSTALCDLLTKVHQGGNPERTRFAEYSIAYRLQDEAEVGVKNSSKAAWPIAYVAAQVFLKFPSIDELFQGMVHSKCPYLAPDYSRAEQSYSADVMIGYLRLWLAVAVVREDLGTVWCWLARTMNSAPVPLVASLLHCTVEMAGSAAQTRYRRQFTKLISYMEQLYLPELEALKQQVSGDQEDRLKASLSRLKVWITSFQRSGQAPPPEGQRIEASQESDLDPNM